MTKHKKITFSCFTLVILGCVFSLTLKARMQKELVWAISLHPFVPATSGLGKGSADSRENFQKFADAFKERYGYTLNLKFFPSPKFLFKAFEDKAVDFAGMPLDVYLLAKNMGVPLKPFFFMTSTGKENAKSCIYVRKDSGIKNVKQLRGKRYVSMFPMFFSKKDALPPKESYIYWILVKKILLKDGIHTPFKDFFKEFRVLPVPWESTVYSVLLKNFDACEVAPGAMKALIEYDKGFSELTPIACLDESVLISLVYRKDLKPEIVKMVKEYFLLHPKVSQKGKTKESDKKVTGLTAYSVEDKDYDIYFQWLKEAEQKGWIEEFNEIMKNTPKPKTKGKSQ